VVGTSPRPPANSSPVHQWQQSNRCIVLKKMSVGVDRRSLNKWMNERMNQWINAFEGTLSQTTVARALNKNYSSQMSVVSPWYHYLLISLLKVPILVLILKFLILGIWRRRILLSHNITIHSTHNAVAGCQKRQSSSRWPP